MSQITWRDPLTAASSAKTKKRIREEDWERYDEIIAGMRRDGLTAEQIQKALADKHGFLVKYGPRLTNPVRTVLSEHSKIMEVNSMEFSIWPLKKRLQRKQPKNKSREERYLNPDIPRVVAASVPPPEDQASTAFHTSVLLVDEDSPGTLAGDDNIPISADSASTEDSKDNEMRAVAEILGELNIADTLTINTDTFQDTGEQLQLIETAEDIASRMLQRLNIEEPGQNLDDEGSDTTIDARGLEGQAFTMEPKGGGIDGFQTHETYGTEEICKMIKNLPNWGNLLEDVESEGDCILRLNDPDLDVPIQLKINLMNALEAVTNFVLQEVSAAIFEDMFERAKAGLRTFSQAESESVYPRYFAAHYFSKVGGSLVAQGKLMEAHEMFQRAHETFGSCAEIPSWAFLSWVEARLTLSSAIFLNGDNEESLRLTKNILRDIGTFVLTRDHFEAVVRVLEALAGRHSLCGDSSYLFVYIDLSAALVPSMHDPRMGSLFMNLLVSMAGAIRRATPSTSKRFIPVLAAAYKFVKRERLFSTRFELEFLSDIADCLRAHTEHYMECRAIYRYIIEQYSHSSGESSVTVLTHTLNLSATYFAEGKFLEALNLVDKVLNAYMGTGKSMREAAVTDPAFEILYIAAETLASRTLQRRGLLLYAQPFANDVVRAYEWYHRKIGHVDYLDALMRKADIDEQLGVLPTLPLLPVDEFVCLTASADTNAMTPNSDPTAPGLLGHQRNAPSSLDAILSTEAVKSLFASTM